MKRLADFIEWIMTLHKRSVAWRRFISVLAAVVVFTTTYALILPALTLDKKSVAKRAGIEIEETTDAEPAPEAPKEEKKEEPKEEVKEEPAAEPAEVSSPTDEGNDDTQDPQPQPETPAEPQEEQKSDDQPAAAGSDQPAQTEEQTEAEAPAEEVTEPVQAAEVVDGITTFKFEDKDYTLTATYGKDAGLPDDVSMLVEEIHKDKKAEKELYLDYYEKALEAVEKDRKKDSDFEYARFFDISFLSNGKEVEPKGPVTVKVEFEDAIDVKDEKALQILHFEEDEKYKGVDLDKAEIKILDEKYLTTDLEDKKVTEIEFDTDRFSVYGVVYTVNYEFVNGILKTRYDVDGDSYQVSVEYPAAARIKAGSSLKVELIPEDSAEYQEYLKQAEAALTDPNQTVKKARFFDITILDPNGKEIEPAAAVKVNIELAPVDTSGNNGVELIHITDDGQNEVMKDVDLQKSDKDTVEGMQFETDGFSVYGVVETETLTTEVITAKGETFEITVTYGADAEIPEGAYLKAREILEETEEYEVYYEKALKALDEDSEEENYLAGLGFARFFDVTIYNREGQKIEPKAPVEVTISYVDPVELLEDENFKVVHFADTETEIIDIETEEPSVTEIVYEQNGFSVIGTVAETNAYGWPTVSNNPYVVILQDGSNYYAVAHDGSLREIHYLNGTVSFLGPGTTSLDYLDDYLWTYTVVSNSRHTARLSTYGAATTEYIDPYYGLLNPETPDAVIGSSQRTLNINNGKIYATYWGTQYSITAEGGELNRTTLEDDNAAPIYFAELSSFTANDSESDSYDFIDIDALIDQWKKQMTQDLIVDKTAEVYDYENRIYQVDLAASSGYHLVDPSLALEFVVDASRSMFFPENLYEQGAYNNIQELRSWINTNGNRSQVYYIITAPNGAATNWAIYYNTNRNAWYIVDASNHDAPDGNNSEGYALSGWSSNAGYEGKIYISDEKVAGQPWNRLDYMRLAVDAAARVMYAVDPSAQIGLVSFNSARTSGNNQHPATFAYGPFTADQIDQLEDSLYRISLDGGTNHQAGLERAYTEFTNNFVNIKNCQTTVVLITDGAPNASGVNWTTIGLAADTLKAMTNNYGDHTRLYTLGLSIEHIGNNKQQLANISSDPDTCAFNAEKSTEVVDCITKIIEALVIDANLIGNVTDVIDPAFYPVDPSDGKPVTSGTWITAEGAVVAAGSEDAVGQIIYENGEWKVLWNNQTIDWPTYTDSTKTEIQTHGWNGRIYVKSQEDFLGGNDINTNADGSKAEALQYVNPHTQVPVDISSDDAEKIKEFDTPYVNVDELAINENSTEWTVYLGESVDPRTELEELLDQVRIYEVVKEDGSLVYTLNPGSTTNPTDKETTGATIDLNTVLGTLDWNTLIAGDPIETEYTAYGHTPGSIWVTLTQEVVTGEDDLTPSPHNTAVVGEEVEKYTLTVTYEPYDASVADYHTGNNITGSHGADTDEMVSENVHIINVFAKGMQITKTDESFNRELIGAKFVLYRTAREDDDLSKVTTIDGAGGNYFPVAELDLSQSAVGTINPVEKLASGEKYYLVETVAPESHNLLDHPLPVTLTITDSFVPKPGTTSQDTRPTSGIYDWTQTAVLNLGDDDSAVKRTDENNTDLTHTAIIADSENAILYFRIANTGGYVLPEAGGPGTLLYTLSGLAMIVTALMYGFRLRRRERRVNG